MEALNKVAARAPTGEIADDEAVKMVYQALVKQDDEEQAARLGRKNAQIMDRLANLQSHQRLLINKIRDSHVFSEKAKVEADSYLKRAQAASNEGTQAFPLLLESTVPLLNFRIISKFYSSFLIFPYNSYCSN